MNRFVTVNLDKYYNHKIIYRQEPKEKIGKEIGLDNVFILRSDIKLNEHQVLDEVDFDFCFKKFDNVVCDRQRIQINAQAQVSKIHFVAFSYWGDTNEYFKLIYDDLSEENIRVPFTDWSHMAYGCIDVSFNYDGKTTTIRKFITTGAWKHLAYLHHITCETAQRKTVKEIVLPDNMFIHIFAITLEK
ncbi:MAG: hypothetical protein ACLTAN_09065 [Christensenellaceae bacterium]